MKTCKFPMGKTLPAIVSVAVALLLFTSSSFATIFYVSTTGNDATGTGTALSPWKTLSKATTAVSGVGDIIHVNSGTYVETVQCSLRPGVSIEGDNSFTTIIRSTLTSAFTPILVLGSAEGTNGNQHLSNLRFEGQLTTQWGVLVSGRSNVSIYNCRFYDFYDVGVAFRGRTDFADGAPAIYSTGNSFHHNYMWNCATIDDSYGRGCLEVGGQTGMLIYNDTIIQTARATGFNGYCIKNINQGFLKGMKIYNCYLEVPPYPYAANGMGNNRWDFATEFSDIWGMEVYNNRILGSCDQNFQRLAAPYTYSVYYHDNIFGRNTVQFNPESGIILEYLTQTGIIENNTFMNVAFPITYSLRAASEVSNNTIQKNLMYGVGITGGSNSGQAVRFITDGSYTYTVSNWKFYNNTVMAYAAHAPFWGVDVPGGASATNIDVTNNIVRDFQAGSIHIFDAGRINTLYVRNNNTNAGGIFISGTPTNYTNSGNTTVSPSLNTNYQPIAGSPVIDAGINVGLSYTGIAPDRGFAEFAAALPVKLVELTVSENNGSNILQWKTASEINSSHFIIQRSADGVNFDNISSVTATGYSSSLRSYSFTDYTLHSAINYYRLIMVDKDNSKEYSNIVFVKQGTDSDLEILAARLSSSANSLSVTVSSKQKESALMSVIDNTGKVLLNERVTLQKGMNFLDKPIQRAAQGIYYVRVQTGSETTVKNILSSN